ncbi:MAG: alpha/beta fold hydrolase [Pirellulaceae bacterium]|nr:alpha/beta fold hydrolase [Pirellulaceae bacterium]
MVRVPLAEVELNVLDQGCGTPLLLVHGFPLDHTMWSGQVDALADVCRVIAPDLRGFGTSGVSAGTVTMERLADDLAELLDALGIVERVALCGLSMGGYVAWQFWRRHRSRLAKLILCDTRAAADAPETAQVRRDSAERVLNEGPGFLADGMIEKLFAPKTGLAPNIHDSVPVALSKDAREHRAEIIEATRQTILNTSPVGIAAALRGMAQRADVTGLLPDIDVPTLVVCGQYDAISTVDEMRNIAARIPAARFVEVPDAGHMAPLENPAVVNEAIRSFLEATST